MDWMAASGIWFTSTKERPPRALAPLSGKRRPSRRTRVERLRSESCEPPEVAVPPAILPFVAPRLPLPAKLGMRVCTTSRRLEPRPVRSISSRLITVTGTATASAAVGILEPVTTKDSNLMVSLAAVPAADGEPGAVWAAAGVEAASQPAREASSRRGDLFGLVISWVGGSAGEPGSRPGAGWAAARGRLTTMAPERGSGVATSGVPASRRLIASSGA